MSRPSWQSPTAAIRTNNSNTEYYLTSILYSNHKSYLTQCTGKQDADKCNFTRKHYGSKKGHVTTARCKSREHMGPLDRSVQRNQKRIHRHSYPNCGLASALNNNLTVTAQYSNSDVTVSGHDSCRVHLGLGLIHRIWPLLCKHVCTASDKWADAGHWLM